MVFQRALAPSTFERRKPARAHLGVEEIPLAAANGLGPCICQQRILLGTHFRQLSPASGFFLALLFLLNELAKLLAQRCFAHPVHRLQTVLKGDGIDRQDQFVQDALPMLQRVQPAVSSRQHHQSAIVIRLRRHKITEIKSHAC